MRCSSFEPLLDDFVDGTLSPLVRARVLRHVDECDHCRGLLEELRVVDALLLVPRQLDSAANFTFRTMAEVRTMRSPHVHRTPALGVVLAYLVFAWIAIGAWFVLGGQTSRGTLGFFGTLAVQYGQGVASLSHATARLFGAATPDVGVAMGAILAFDALLAVGLIFAYALLRARWTERRSEGPL
jgi:anti-sigma factor RsiW